MVELEREGVRDEARAVDKVTNRATIWGYVLILGAVLLLSVDALLIQEVSHLSEMTVVFYRYSFMGFTIALYYLFTEQQDMYRKFYDIGFAGLLAGAINAGGGIAFTIAVLNTHTANVFIIIATTPFTASIFSYLFFNEVVPLRTIIAFIVAFTAIVVVIGIELSADFDTAWYGNIMAFISSIAYAAYLTIIRGMNLGVKSSEQIDYVPCLIVAAIIESGIGAAAGAQYDTVTKMDLLYLILQGVVVLSIGSAILTFATKFISSPEVCMFSLLDTVLEPIWVWLAGFDTPPYYTIYAGIFVISAVLVNSILALYEEDLDEDPKFVREAIRDAARDPDDDTPILSENKDD